MKDSLPTETMTDAELAEFLGVSDEPFRDKFIAGLSAEKRQLFDKMKAVERFDQGDGPCPDGVILCHAPHSVFGRAK